MLRPHVADRAIHGRPQGCGVGMGGEGVPRGYPGITWYKINFSFATLTITKIAHLSI
jgi:hypothetical protein